MDGNHVAMGLVQLLLSRSDHGDQPEVFYQRLQEPVAPRSEHGHAGGARLRRVVWIQRICTVCDDRMHRCKGIWTAVMSYMHEFYFESAAMILTLITVGKMLEARSKGKTTDALKGLMKLAPKTATLLRDGEETEVPIDQVKKGDMFVVRPGENIPVDGVVLEGQQRSQ